MIEGWPTDKGPLRTLMELGNLWPETTPDWVHEPTHSLENGRFTYKCRSHRALTPENILDVAALIVEGYKVYILPRGKYVRFNIFEPKGTN